MMLVQGGEVYCWGRGTWGQSGLGSTDNVCLPRRLEALGGRRIVQVAAGARHSLALEMTGSLFAFGSGEEGQLGLGDGELPTAVLSPRRVPAQLLHVPGG